MSVTTAIPVLFYFHSRGIGGVGGSLLTLLRNLDRERFCPTAVMPGPGAMKEALNSLKIPAIEVPSVWWIPMRQEKGERHYYRLLGGMPERVDAIERVIREHQIRIVHTDTLSCADAALAARLNGIPHIWHIHGTFENDPSDSAASYLPMELVFRIVVNLSTRIVAVSKPVEDLVKSYVLKAPVTVIPNGLDLDRFDAANKQDSSLLLDFPMLANKRLVGLVGRIDPVKGVEDYLEAAMEVLAERKDIAFLLVGSEEHTDLAANLRERARAAGMGDRFVLSGARSDIEALLGQLDIVVSASLREGLPMSCLEAMAAGKPVVATRCSGNEDVVIDGNTGLLVDVGAPGQMAQAILRVLGDENLAASLGRNGRKRVTEEFSASMFAKRFAFLYDEVAKEKCRKFPDPWGEVFLRLAGDLGTLGLGQVEHGRQIRDLRSFEATLKNNFAYRTLRRLFRRSAT